MATNHTANYNLSQWETGDLIQRTDFNGDNAKIDAALKGHADGLAGAMKAIGSGGHTCRIYTGSYEGAGTSSSMSPIKIAVPFYPVAIIVSPIEQKYSSSGGISGFAVRGVSLMYDGVPSDYYSVQWFDASVQLYATGRVHALDENGGTYYFTVFGYTLDED